MIAALSPALSWLAIGAVAGFAIAVYLLASGWVDDMERRRARPPVYPPVLHTAPLVRVLGGIYDHETRGDFDD